MSPNRDHGVIDRRQNLLIFTQVIKGMEEIHKHDILHRDLKPENIFIDGSGESVSAKIGDFGLARLLKPQANSAGDSFSEKLSTPDRRMESASSHTMKKLRNLGGFSRPHHYFSSIAGTEVYMAPEIKQHYFAGTLPQRYQNVDINKAQDIYQLGLILYELCHKMPTMHQRNVLFKKLLKERLLSKDCPLRQDKHVEYGMILAMTEEKAQSRPGIPEIISWLKSWEQEIEEHDRRLQAPATTSASSTWEGGTVATGEFSGSLNEQGREELPNKLTVPLREEPRGNTRRAKANLHVKQER